jgi:hypothetical protein
MATPSVAIFNHGAADLESHRESNSEELVLIRMSRPFASHQFNRGDEELNRELLLAPGNRIPDDASQAAERRVTCSHTSDENVQVVVTSLSSCA